MNDQLDKLELTPEEQEKVHRPGVAILPAQVEWSPTALTIPEDYPFDAWVDLDGTLRSSTILFVRQHAENY